MLNLPVYLDNNATTRMDERVMEAMLPYFTQYYGNAASRGHVFGWQANEGVEQARKQVALLINAEPNEVIFTSGATEACNLALKGVFEMYAGKGNHIITAATEHPAVLDTCRHIEKLGGDITFLPVNHDGLINLVDLEKAIKPKTVLVSVMYANNETGVIQPIKEIGIICKKHGILFFTDATQAAGKISVNVEVDKIDMMAFSAHKMYGPKGVGALYVRRKNPRVRLAALIDGGGHERGIRSGTLNVPGIVGFGKACELGRIFMKEESERSRKLRDQLETGLMLTGEVFINGSIEHRLPNTSNIGFKNIDGEELLIQASKQIALSAGSACTSATLEPSHVLLALGIDEAVAGSSIRFSSGRFTTEQEILYTIDLIKDLIDALKGKLVAKEKWRNS